MKFRTHLDSDPVAAPPTAACPPAASGSTCSLSTAKKAETPFRAPLFRLAIGSWIAEGGSTGARRG
jgi:hypothetical protein